MDVLHLIFAALAAGAIGVAVGFYREASREREQVDYLRKRLARFDGDLPPAATQRSDSRALAPVSGGR